jgi:hypothetical protein
VVVDLTADSDDGEGGEGGDREGYVGPQRSHAAQQQQPPMQPGPHEVPSTAPSAPPAMATPAPLVIVSPAAAAAPTMTATGSGTKNPGAVPLVPLAAADAGAAPGAEHPGAAAPSAAAVAAGTLLPRGLQLPDASSAVAMERHLIVLMARALQPLLPPPQYSRLMG